MNAVLSSTVLCKIKFSSPTSMNAVLSSTVLCKKKKKKKKNLQPYLHERSALKHSSVWSIPHDSSVWRISQAQLRVKNLLSTVPREESLKQSSVWRIS